MFKKRRVCPLQAWKIIRIAADDQILNVRKSN